MKNILLFISIIFLTSCFEVVHMYDDTPYIVLSYRANPDGCEYFNGSTVKISCPCVYEVGDTIKLCR